MAQTTSTVVASHVLSEIIRGALNPLWARSGVLSPLMNESNIDGEASGVRKIPKRTAGTIATADTEGAAITSFDSLGYTTAISVTPTGYYQAIQLTMKAIRRRMPGATYEQVLAAIASGAPEILPIVADSYEQLADSHARRVETLAMSLLTSASESAGTTTVNLSFATLLDAKMKLMDNVPENEDLAFVIEEVGVTDLQNALLSGSGASLAAIWSNSNVGVSLFEHRPDLLRNGFRAAFMGIPVFSGDKNLMTTANAAADRVGGLVCVGQGETGAPGSKRSFGEICYGHDMQMEFEYTKASATFEVFARQEVIAVEHTDEHYVQLIYGIT